MRHRDYEYSRRGLDIYVGFYPMSWGLGFLIEPRWSLGAPSEFRLVLGPLDLWIEYRR